MFVRKCDRCGIDSTKISDKNFLSFDLKFSEFSTTLDFCPKCWGEIGMSIMTSLNKDEDPNADKTQAD